MVVATDICVLRRLSKTIFHKHACWRVTTSIGAVYMCLSNGSSDEAKAHGVSLTQQGPVTLRTAHNTAGTIWPAYSLFVSYYYDSLDGFSVISSIMHGTHVTIPGTPISLLESFSLKIFWELILLRFLDWRYLL